jgi:hypothetical protein
MGCAAAGSGTTAREDDEERRTMKRSHTTPKPEEAAGGDDHHRAGSAAPADSRWPYSPPRLRRHGRLAELTCFGGSQVVDSGAGLGQQI